MEQVVREIFSILGIEGRCKTMHHLLNRVKNILDPIPLGEMGHDIKHYADHINLCLPEKIKKCGDNERKFYLNHICKTGDLEYFCERAAKNMKEQREAIKTMLRELGVNKEETGNDAWKDTIRHVVKLFGAMKPEEFKPLIKTITATALTEKHQHQDVKTLFSKIMEERKAME